MRACPVANHKSIHACVLYCNVLCYMRALFVSGAWPRRAPRSRLRAGARGLWRGPFARRGRFAAQAKESNSASGGSRFRTNVLRSGAFQQSIDVSESGCADLSQTPRLADAWRFRAEHLRQRIRLRGLVTHHDVVSRTHECMNVYMRMYGRFQLFVPRV